ncbi:serine hydrolase [Pedobacter sp. SYP-B3415]|uniref:serine hydrolase domain-containing protein n=1 Tax=Pedobacter sp. SYP-B3415 TaxID=2496641 RepID=UPI0013EA9645|nr:serine hydrolase domain-containing protein [Pedobacter sp. SYP-B3415]
MEQRIRIGLLGFKERYHAPSLVFILVHQDQILFSDALGYTNIERKTAASIDSRYQLQSVSKLFTATLAMKLREKGIVDLDDDIRKFVPEFEAGNRRDSFSGTSLLQLLTHSSGLPRNAGADVGFARQVQEFQLTGRVRGQIQAATQSEFLRSLRKIPRPYAAYEFLPVDSRHYSNMGYTLLGIGLGRAARANFEDAVMSEICKPLGMADSGFGTVSSSTNTIATGYSYNNNTVSYIRTPDFIVHASTPAAGMYSTGRDLAKFISAQFPRQQNLLSQHTIRMMQSLGIGWQRAYPFVKHEGAMLGARTEVVIHPGHQLGWAVLTNVTDFEFNRLNDYIASLLLPLFTKPPVLDMNDYVGDYYLEGRTDTLRIYQKDGKLYSTYLEDILPDEPLNWAGANTLKATGTNGHPVIYNFVAVAGKICLLNLDQLTWVKK